MQVNESNYRDLLIRRMEGELSQGELIKLETWMAAHPISGDEWQRLQRTRLKPDLNVSFPHKARLYRRETAEVLPAVEATVRKMTPYPYIRYISAIAAAILLAAVYFILRPQHGTVESNGVANTNPAITVPEKVIPQPDNTMLAGGSKGDKTSPPEKKEDKKKDEKKKEPRRTIILVDQPLFPEHTVAVTMMKGFEARPIEISIPSTDIIEAGSVPATAYAKYSRQNTWPGEEVDFSKANQEEEYVSNFTRVYRFLTRNVSLRKEEREEENVYAFKLETKNVSIYKTFKGF